MQAAHTGRRQAGARNVTTAAPCETYPSNSAHTPYLALTTGNPAQSVVYPGESRSRFIRQAAPLPSAATRSVPRPYRSFNASIAAIRRCALASSSTPVNSDLCCILRGRSSDSMTPAFW